MTGRGDRTPPHPIPFNRTRPTALFIDISAMLQSNMADISLPRGRGRKARKDVRGQVLGPSRLGGLTARGIGTAGLRGWVGEHGLVNE